MFTSYIDFKKYGRPLKDYGHIIIERYYLANLVKFVNNSFICPKIRNKFILIVRINLKLPLSNAFAKLLR